MSTNPFSQWQKSKVTNNTKNQGKTKKDRLYQWEKKAKGGITIKSTPLDPHRAFPLSASLQIEYLSLISAVKLNLFFSVSLKEEQRPGILFFLSLS